MAGMGDLNYYQSREDIQVKLGKARRTIRGTVDGLRQMAREITSSPRSMRWNLKDQILKMARDLESELRAAYRADTPPYEGRQSDEG